MTWLLAFLAPALACAQTFSNYRVIYDPAPHARRATWATVVPDGRRLEMVFSDFGQDDEAGASPWVVWSADGGRTWTSPKPFALEILTKLGQPAKASAALSTWGLSRRGTAFAIGYHVAKGAQPETYEQDLRFRESSLVWGRRDKGASGYSFWSDAPGTHLGEQFGYGGIRHSSGRLVFQVWGAAKRGDNWQCGVLLSDDDGRTWRYRMVGHEPDPAIRDKPLTPAGFNEQTLFETRDGAVVSLIRGREKLGRVPDSPRDTWYFRSESRDRGETWSKPEPTNLAGTGAPPHGVRLRDGSLLMASRLPYSRTLVPLKDKSAQGLHFARSEDGGRTWSTVHVVQADPEGRPFDNYYNAMNGQFVERGKGRWWYVFPHFSVAKKIHRVLAIDIAAK